MRTDFLKKQKLIFGFAAGLILGLCFLVNVSAQSKTITQDEFEPVKTNAAEKLKNISYIAFK